MNLIKGIHAFTMCGGPSIYLNKIRNPTFLHWDKK